MLGITNLKTGVVIDLDGVPFTITKYQHSKMGRGGAILRTTLKNLLTGATLEKTFKGDSKITPADIRKSKAQFLYKDGTDYTFMDSESFNQFIISSAVLGQTANFLTEGIETEVVYFNDQPISVELPTKIKLKITEADPAVRGDTAGNPTKDAVIETGLKLKVPLFVKIGDSIMVDTRDGSYIERAN